MEYLYCEKGNYEDYSSGHVLYGGKNIPNFPVRLVNEMFGRAVHYSDKKTGLVIYDPCCGGGYSLTVLGFFHSDAIQYIYGSDIDENVLLYAKKNLALLNIEGLNNRKEELKKMFHTYGKESHRKAIDSIDRLKNQISRNLEFEVFHADCTMMLNPLDVDIIITDIPYGNLVEWGRESEDSLNDMLEQLSKISSKKMILALCLDKKQKIKTDKWIQLEKQNIGKRRFVIMTNKRL